MIFSFSRIVLHGLFLLLSIVSLSACAKDTPARRFTEILHRYPQTAEPLKIRSLAEGMTDAVALGAASREVVVMVHPAYSLFFRDTDRSAYTEAKYGLLKFQLDSEALFISETAKAGKLLILVLPGDYSRDSIAPLSYTYYLNTTTGAGKTVFYVNSEASSSGTLPPHAMVTLYQALQAMRAERVLLGGGYIGRCQREFHNQLLNYVDRIATYVVPEISAISPDDVTDREAADILAGLGLRDYSLVRKFIEKRTQGAAEIRSLPQKRSL